MVNGPHSTDLRHYGLTTPQGFDPFLPEHYKQAVEQFVPFYSNREFRVDPLDVAFLQYFGVKFVMTARGTEVADALQAPPGFQLLEPTNTFFQVYEYRDALPVWRFQGDVQVLRWTPEHRGFEVDSETGGPFALLEQFFPGWHAYVDGTEVGIARWKKTFQAIDLPPGHHQVAFIYRPASLRIGAAVSSGALIVLLLVMWRMRPGRIKAEAAAEERSALQGLRKYP
jgi:hypothetical protein